MRLPDETIHLAAAVQLAEVRSSRLAAQLGGPAGSLSGYGRGGVAVAELVLFSEEVFVAVGVSSDEFLEALEAFVLSF